MYKYRNNGVQLSKPTCALYNITFAHNKLCTNRYAKLKSKQCSTYAIRLQTAVGEFYSEVGNNFEKP